AGGGVARRVGPRIRRRPARGPAALARGAGLVAEGQRGPPGTFGPGEPGPIPPAARRGRAAALPGRRPGGPQPVAPGPRGRALSLPRRQDLEIGRPGARLALHGP